LLTTTGAMLGQLVESSEIKVAQSELSAIFSPLVADFKLRPDMCGDDLAVHLHGSGETYWRLIQHGTMADIAHQLRCAGQLLGTVDWNSPDSRGFAVHHPRLADIARASWQGYLTELVTFGRLGTVVSDLELYSLLRLTQMVETLVWKTMIDDFSSQVYEQAISDSELRRNLWLALEQVYCPDINHDNMPFLAQGGLMYLALDDLNKPFSALAEAFGLVSALSVWSGNRKSQSRMDKMWQKLVLQNNRKPYLELLPGFDQMMPWDETLFKQLAYAVSAALNL
jgi:hypothetical protein